MVNEPASSPCQAPPGYWGDDDPRPGPKTPGRAPILQRSLLISWAIWLTVVFLTNSADAAKTAKLLDEDWNFASGNFAFLTATTARYGTPTWMNAVLFAGVIAWEGLAAILFWRAAWKLGTPCERSATFAAFTASLLLWLAFAIADEVFIAYAVEGTHLRLFIAQVLTLLAVELLPRR